MREHRGATGDLEAEIIGSSPINSVSDDPLNVRIEEGFARFVTGLEIEYLSRSAKEATAASENVSVLKPGGEYHRIGLRNEEWLCIYLLKLKIKVIGDSRGNGMRGHNVPNDLLLVSSPIEISVSSDYALEGL